MRIELITMPWQMIDRPSLALGILKAIIKRDRPRHSVRVRHANLEFADWYSQQRTAGWSPGDYARVASIFEPADWMWWGALRGVDEERIEAYDRFVHESGHELGELADIHRAAPAFIERLADEIVAGRPDVVGFSLTFMQTGASLAAAQAIRARDRSIVIVVGGASCEAPTGPALQRVFPFLDYVVSGEAEESLPLLLDAIESGREPEGIPGISWWSDGVQRTTPRLLERQTDLRTVPVPDYDDYFAAIRAHASFANRFYEANNVPWLPSFGTPQIVLESSRGCWWGSKHHCVFCAFNATVLGYRTKMPEQFLNEIDSLVEKYRALDILMADNILDMSYFETVMPTIAARGWDLRFWYDMKSNLSAARVDTLAAAGIVHCEAGIESLSSDVLRRMNKGVTGPRNVALLRDIENSRIKIDWMWLYGFAGETPETYRKAIAKIPALVHLQPPIGCQRVMLARGSPYFEQRDDLFLWSRPYGHYRYTYGDIPELADIAFDFEYAPVGIGDDVAHEMEDAIRHWEEAFPESTLLMHDDGDRIVIEDRRAGWPQRTITLDDQPRVAAYRALDRDLTIVGLASRLRAAGFAPTTETLRGWLAEWVHAGLVYEDEDRWVALATRRSTLRLRTGAVKAGVAVSHDRCLEIGNEDPWPDDAQLERLSSDEVRDVVIRGSVVIDDAHDAEGVAFLRFLRDASSHLIHVRWWGRVSVDGALLGHLSQPGSDAWEPDRYGACYWRLGPGFVRVTDRRSGTHETGDLEGQTMDLFLRLMNPTRESDLADNERPLVDWLVNRRLVLRLGAWLVSLPVHLHHWPL